MCRDKNRKKTKLSLFENRKIQVNLQTTKTDERIQEDSQLQGQHKKKSLAE